ncbi:MAG: MgtC/SapB family protein [Lamprobacter sp.]|uniref:MgtC/SapB family protein n=1 Tax=Lamprobacter sp. TaxID=3100796 RepID=UPI002B261E9F|nr:MgtC/SapB family protein [Lamprobacter sp.]MEA3642563.1 MgtC/SapB family protein [Lamprobacter sp.]
MPQDDLIQLFSHFGLAALLGFLIGLERELRDETIPTVGIRDFVLFSLIGALSSYAALGLQASWLILAGFAGFLALLLSSYWVQRDQGPGITTELAAVLTFFLGVIIMHGATLLAIALAILMLGVLFPKDAIKRFRSRVQIHEMRAVLLFLTITFVILPVLPRQSLDTFLTHSVGTVTAVDQSTGEVDIRLDGDARVSAGDRVMLSQPDGTRIGFVRITAAENLNASGGYEGRQLADVRPDISVDGGLGIEFLEVMASAVRPYMLWLIVVLVSFVSFAGYVSIKILGSRVGIGLTGLIGGLVSSTVTTLSFARRSIEAPAGNSLFAMAIILASSVMFPRLLLEIAVINPPLMKNIAVPLTAMGITGALMAAVLYFRSRQPDTATVNVEFHNPFSLKSAVSFGLVFAGILMFTRLATFYLGDAWLPAVALVSGLTDADAIAFSMSSLQASGLIHIDWAAFNLVLGAISNTFMKLFLVLGLGDRALFKTLIGPFLVIGIVGLVSTLLYYDLGTALQAAGG